MLFRSISMQCVTWSAGAFLAFAMSTSSQADVPCTGPSCEKPSNGCWYGVDAICIPNRLSHGYHQPTWRRWPLDMATTGAAPRRLRRQTDAIPPAEIPDKTEEGDQTPTGRGRPLSEQILNRTDNLPPTIRSETPVGPAEDQQQPALDLPDELERDRSEDPFRDDPLFPSGHNAATERALSHGHSRLVRYLLPTDQPHLIREVLPPVVGPTPSAPQPVNRAEMTREPPSPPLLNAAMIAPREADSSNPLRFADEWLELPDTVVPARPSKLIQSPHPSGPRPSGGTQGKKQIANPFRP